MVEPRITYRDIHPTPRVERLVRKEVLKLDRYAPHLTGCHVWIEIPHRHHTGSNPYHVRVELTLPGAQVVVGRQPTLHPTAKDLGLAEVPRGFELSAPDRELLVAVRHAFDAARRRLQDVLRRQRHAVKEHAPRSVGRVTQLFPERGYGFLVTGDGREIYFHRNSVLDGEFEDLALGDDVRFVEEAGLEGPQASTVRPSS